MCCRLSVNDASGQKRVLLVMQFSLGKIAIVLLVTGSMAACTNSARFSGNSTPPETLTPLSSSSVQTTSLPPLSGTTTADGALLTTPEGQSQFPASDFNSSDPLLGTQPNTNGSIITADATGMPTTTQTRTLTGPLTESKMLGGWTVISGADTCQINLTQTAKPGTNRFRASAPGCNIAVLNSLASWQLAGTQVQLFSESGQLIATLLQSGNRFIGSLAGGQGISMVG